MNETDEVIYERTCAMTGRKIREPFTLLPDLPLTVYIQGDDPLMDILPLPVIEKWNEKVRLNIESGGEIERREREEREAARALASASEPPPSFYDGDARLACLPSHVNYGVDKESWNEIFRSMIKNRALNYARELAEAEEQDRERTG